jgi:hypothetical protein
MVRASFLALVLAAAFSLPAQSHHAGDLVLEPYSFRTFDGSAHPAELGHLWVQENRSGPSDRLIEIVFVRLKSTAPKPRSPVVFLPGGSVELWTAIRQTSRRKRFSGDSPMANLFL